jgi:hypothetical protein
MPTGWTATDTVITGSAGNDPAVAALNLAAPFAWRIDSVAGDFTLEGYRIYTANGTVNGAGAGLINQSLVHPLRATGFFLRASSCTISWSYGYGIARFWSRWDRSC